MYSRLSAMPSQTLIQLFTASTSHSPAAFKTETWPRTNQKHFVVGGNGRREVLVDGAMQSSCFNTAPCRINESKSHCH